MFKCGGENERFFVARVNQRASMNEEDVVRALADQDEPKCELGFAVCDWHVIVGAWDSPSCPLIN